MFLFAPDEGDAIQVVEGHAFTGGQRIPRRTDKKQAFAMDKDAHERGLLLVHPGDAQIHLAVQDHTQDLLRISHLQIDFDARIVPVVGADGGGHEVGSDYGGGAHGDLPLLERSKTAEDRIDLLMKFEELLGIGEQDLAFPCEPDSLAGAVKEPAADLGLQGADLLAHGRLGQKEFPGRLREAPHGRHLAECLELVDIHKNPL